MRKLKTDPRSIQIRESQQRARARKRLEAQGLPIPPELAVRPSGFTGKYTDQEKKQASRNATARYRSNHKREVNEALKARQDRNRAIVIAAKANPCQDCDQMFAPVAMDFDHRVGEEKKYGRTGGVAGICAKGMSVKSLLAEIAKCDLVCANCHRVRTATRAGWDESLLTSSSVE